MLCISNSHSCCNAGFLAATTTQHEESAMSSHNMQYCNNLGEYSPAIDLLSKRVQIPGSNTGPNLARPITINTNSSCRQTSNITHVGFPTYMPSG